MIGYQRRGQLPPKPHTAFYVDGALVHEQCFTYEGFDGPFSVLYHRNPPQNHSQGESVKRLWPARVEAGEIDDLPLRRRHLQSQSQAPFGTPTTGRVPLMFNADLTIGVVRPTQSDTGYFANGDGDDVIYCHRGGGSVFTWFGRLDFGPGDYVLLPRAVPYRIAITDADQHWFWTECRTPLKAPTQYRNAIGQLRMDAPYTHRDFRLPEWDASGAGEFSDPDGEKVVITKRRDRFTQHVWENPVLDVLGWDGTIYPAVFPILNFSAKAGAVHLPPTVHGTFATKGSLICSFVPRTVDFGEGAIPCPYPHSNVDVDEVIFYCDGDFTSRRGIDAGSISFHPAGVPHGPHPGAYEGSIGVREVHETAVMIDTFDPLRITPQGMGLEAPEYDESWIPSTATLKEKS